ncbi:multicopper oxidase domain-containing protein [Bacillaceae bacterium SIJ1]|uniref:multicopper oxidase family protein n=1 Tax=Litoribacterium kuwaitense TaxID=1398745 RepID=UPI0013EAA394|nr:multicopper oxidase domain-containing protein [Litoribacterium kuwaitense]NGP44192.1 multicopper oxidase domain-containing protein [Litoribacterium kuwaitense]
MKKLFMSISLAAILLLSACGTSFGHMNMMNSPEERSEWSMMRDQMMGERMMRQHESMMREPMMNESMMMGQMGHGHDGVRLQDSTGQNALNIPPILESDQKSGNDVYYTIEAQKGQTEIFEGYQTDTLGYNSSFLGPVLKLQKGQTVHMTLKNRLDEETTFHWHGLIIEGDADGGPHSVIQPGEEKEITFKVQQERATLWFHPHPKGKTAKQVFEGLAGLMYIEDDAEDPYVYGENDFPLIIQDRTFNDQKQLDYEAVKNFDGTTGETLLINGTLNPYLTVNQEKVRLRLLNGSNMRNYTFKLSNNQAFQQVASDGGLLNEPVELTELQLTPSERAEIVVDFSKMKEDEEVELIMDDGTVLLPFEVTDVKSNIQKKTPKPKKPITISEEDMQKPVTKTFELFGMGQHVTINGKKFDMDRIDFTQKKGETEVWEIYNKPDMMGGMIHPFHIHGTQFKVISINGEAPPENLQGYKDTITLDPGDRAKIAVKFAEEGIYMYHCHILEHEDNGMMGQIKVE